MKTTVHNVGTKWETPRNIETKDCSDGLGRGIQSRQKIDEDNAKVISTFFDDAGRPCKITKPYNGDAPVHSFNAGNFDEINQILNNSVNYASYIQADANAYAFSETQYYDDPLGRVKKVSAPGYDYRLASGHTSMFWYFGVPADNNNPFLIPNTTPAIQVTLQNGFISSFNIAGTSRSLNVNDLNALSNNTVFTGCNHFLTVTKDPDGKFTQEMKDLFGRTVATRTTNGSEVIQSKYEHDILGNVLKEIAPGTNLISNSEYRYNTLGQLTYKKSPDGANDSMEYDAAGNLTRKLSYSGTIAAKKILRYEYDDISRLTQIFQDDPLGRYVPNLCQTNYYDNTDAINGVGFQGVERQRVSPLILEQLKNLQGRLVATIAYTSVNKRNYEVVDCYSYDDEGRIAKKFKVIPGLPIQEITYSYDNHGKVISENFKCGNENSTKIYSYNEFGELKKISLNSEANVLAEYKNDVLGRNSSKTFSKIGTDQITSSYNIRGWLDSIIYRKNNSFSQKLSYTGSYSGNITSDSLIYSQQNSTGGINLVKYRQEFTYDNINRLTNTATKNTIGTVIAEFGGTYNYDLAGRFKDKKEGSATKSYHDKYVYYSGTSRLKRSKSVSGAPLYLYDYYGNLVIDMSKKMVITYDWRDMPVKFTFYKSLPVDSTTSSRIHPDNKGTIEVSGYTNYTIEQIFQDMESKKEIEKVSCVYMLYDAAGNRVMKSSSD